MGSQTTCPACKTNVSSVDFFCPVCGKKLAEKPLATSPTKQVFLYLLSAFLPPLGIWPAIKYLRQPDEKSKKVGLVALFLTVLSIMITVWLSAGLISSFQKRLVRELESYQELIN